MGVTIRRYAITGGFGGMEPVSLPRANKLWIIIGWPGKGRPAGSAMGGNGPMIMDIPYSVGLYNTQITMDVLQDYDYPIQTLT